MTTFTPIEVFDIPAQPKRGDSFLIKGDGISDFTHGIFKYPCKFIPHIPRWFLQTYATDLTKQYGVLDPFMGSGTTLVESSLLGYPAYGVDIDPLSKLLSKVKTSRFTANEITLLQAIISDMKKALNKHVGSKIINKHLPTFSTLTYWFSDIAIADLTHIKYLIHTISQKTENKKITDFLTITLASIIRKASKADEQSPKPYISTRIQKKVVDIKASYLNNLEKYTRGLMDFSSEAKSNQIKIIGKDAREIDKSKIKQGRIHLAITSPPYINAFDYVRSLKLENFWLDHLNEDDLPHMYEKQIGTEKVSVNKKSEAPTLAIKQLDNIMAEVHLKDKKRAYIMAEFFKAMQKNLSEVYNLLLPGGFYCIVVGDSQIRGIHTPTSRILIEIAEKIGFKTENDFSYIIRNRYLRIPRQGRGGFIPQDYILVFQK